MDKYHAFAVTFRPKGGITDAQLKTLLNFIPKTAKYYYIITEKSDEERHAHVGLITFQPKRISAFNQMWSRKFRADVESYSSVWKYAYCSKYIYSEEWFTEYLTKDDKTVILAKVLPDNMEDLKKYYVPKQVAKARSKYVFDPELNRLEGYWKDKSDPNEFVNFQTVSTFVCTLMYKERLMKVIRSPRKFHELVNSLVCYINKSESFYLNDFDLRHRMS